MRKNCLIDLFSLDNDQTQFLGRRAILVDSIPVCPESIPRQANLRKYPYMRDVQLITPPRFEVDLIISVDLASTWCIPNDFRRGLPHQPVAIKSGWGWTLMGGETSSDSVISSYLIRMDKDVLAEKLDRIFTEDFRSIPGDQEVDKYSREEARALKAMEQSISLQDQRYVAAAPWKRSRQETARIMDAIDSGKTARKRLEGLGRRMDRDSVFKDKVFAQVNNLEAKGYIERVPVVELHNSGKWYCPLHPVIKPRKPDKVRVTHDASARTAGWALNDFLLKGPDATCKLISVILKARIHPIFLKCDIRDFFMRIKMATQDKDAFRFLFWSDETKQSIIEWRTTVWLFGLLSSPCIAALALKRCASDHADECDEEVRRAIHESTYVDDCFRSLVDVETALKFLNELPKILSKGGFSLAKMVSNNSEVMRNIALEDRVDGVVHFKDSVAGEDSALGMKLDLSTDSFTPAFPQDILTRPVRTRREVLAVVASVWLPLGIFLPFVVPAKIIIQRLASLKLGWDDPVPEEEIKQFEDWRQSLQAIGRLEVPRWIRWRPGQKAEVHVFSDAALRLYGAVAYLRTINEEGEVAVTLLMAKARVFPLNERQSGLHGSMPKRELMGALLATELFKILYEALSELKPTFYLWTDSSSVQRWCFNENLKLETFVANRVTKILSCFSPERLRWVDGKSNSADQLSRGLRGGEHERWLHFLQGPLWLSLDEKSWPQAPPSMELENEQVVLAGVIETRALMGENMMEEDSNILQGLIASTNSFDKIIHRTRMLRRFGEKTLNQIASRRNGHLPYPIEGERERAVISIVKYVQNKYFLKELTCLRSINKGRIKSALGQSRLRSLSPFLGEDGILRIGGRLGNRIDSPHPIILPRDREVVNKLLYKIHADNGHAGAATTNHICRKSYWVLQGGAAARSVVTQCFTCKRRFKPAEFQKMAMHPRARCTPAYPFEATGVDLAGPYSLRSNAGRTTVKRWLALFTCLRCRAVHVEVVDKLNKESFLCALVRFHARRNALRTLWSDNGTNFVGAQRELKECLQEWAKASALELQKKGLQWVFAPAKAPEWGGAYERMIGLFKKIFSGVVDGSQLTLESFHTFAVATEGIMNNRPLVPVPTDRRDPEALSPLSFLCPGVLATSSSDVLPPIPHSRLPLTRSWKFIRGMLDGFWKRWVREYMSLLQSRRKWAVEQRNLRIGDVVLLVDRQTPRDQWPLGVINSTVSGEDGLVRRVSVRTTKSAALERHVAHVVLLEATPDEEAAEGIFSRAAGDGVAAAGDTDTTSSSSLNEEKVTPLSSERSSNSTIKASDALLASLVGDSNSSSCSSPASFDEGIEDLRTRMGVPLRRARLDHPYGT